MQENTCCFFGHRTIVITDELLNSLTDTILYLITEEDVDTFLFGSKSQFDSLCWSIVTEIKNSFPHIRRIYVRAEFPVISESYERYLLESYEDTYFPQNIIGAGKAVYIERNYEMIDRSKYCVIYYTDNQIPSGRRSGTKIAFKKAIKLKRKIYIFPTSSTD